MSLIRKTLKTASVGLQNSIIYKNNFLLGFLSGVFGLFVQFIFWPAFYNAGTEFSYAAIDETVIAGYYLNEMLTYSLLIYFIQRGTSMMNLSGTIKGDIMSGGLNIQLIRPVKYLWNKWIFSISGQIINLGLSLIVFLLVLLFFRFTFVLPSAISDIGYTILFIIFAYILSFLINGILGMLSFWLLETSAINQILGMVIGILSGSLFPIDFIQGRLGDILKYLPFSYLAYFPTQIYLGKVDTAQIITNIEICLFWILFLSILMKKLWKDGIRKYSAFGG